MRREPRLPVDLHDDVLRAVGRVPHLDRHPDPAQAFSGLGPASQLAEREQAKAEELTALGFAQVSRTTVQRMRLAYRKQGLRARLSSRTTPRVQLSKRNTFDGDAPVPVEGEQHLRPGKPAGKSWIP